MAAQANGGGGPPWWAYADEEEERPGLRPPTGRPEYQQPPAGYGGTIEPPQRTPAGPTPWPQAQPPPEPSRPPGPAAPTQQPPPWRPWLPTTMREYESPAPEPRHRRGALGALHQAFVWSQQPAIQPDIGEEGEFELLEPEVVEHMLPATMAEMEENIVLATIREDEIEEVTGEWEGFAGLKRERPSKGELKQEAVLGTISALARGEGPGGVIVSAVRPWIDEGQAMLEDLKHVTEGVRRPIHRTPIVGPLTRGALRTAMGAFTLPPALVEEGIGRATLSSPALDYATREHGDSPEARHAAKTASGLIAYTQWLVPTVKEYARLTREFVESPSSFRGDLTPRNYDTLYETIDRLYNGEQPRIVKYGDYKANEPLIAQQQAYDRDSPEWVRVGMEAIDENPDLQKYYGWLSEQPGISTREAVERIHDRGIEGSANVIAELAGQLVLDPLNLVGPVQKIVGGYDDIQEMRHLDDILSQTLLPTSKSGAEVFDDFGKHGNKMVEMAWMPLEPLGMDNYSKQHWLLSSSADIIRSTLSSLHPDDWTEAMRLFPLLGGDADEVAEAMEFFSKVGLKQELAEPLMHLPAGTTISPMESTAYKTVARFFYDALDEGGGYNPQLLDGIVKGAEKPEQVFYGLVNLLSSHADATFPLSDMPGAYKINQTAKGYFAKYAHMGYTPGWAMRNAMQNFVQGAIDGVFTLPMPGARERFWVEVMGFEPSAVRRGFSSQNPAAEFLQSKDDFMRALKGVAGEADDLTRWQKLWGEKGFRHWLGSGPVLEWSGKVEQWFGETAIYKVAKQFVDRQWRVGRAIPQGAVDDLAGTLDNPGLARQVVNHIVRNVNPENWDEVVEGIKAQAGYIETWRYLDDEELALLGDAGLLEPVMDGLQDLRGEDISEIDRFFDGLVARTYSRADDVFTDSEMTQYGEQILAAWDDAVAQLRRAGLESQAFPHPITPENRQRAQAMAAVIGREIRAATSRAGYWAARSDNVDDWTRAYVQTLQDRLAVSDFARKRLGEVMQVYLPYTELPAPEKTGEATRRINQVWLAYFADIDDAWTQHYQKVVDTFLPLGDEWRQAAEPFDPDTMRATQRVADAMIEDAGRLGEMPKPGQITEAAYRGFPAPREKIKSFDDLLREASQTLGYEVSKEPAKRKYAHAVHSLAHEAGIADDVQGYKSRYRALKQMWEGDPDEFWNLLFRHQAYHEEAARGVQMGLWTEEEAARIAAGELERFAGQPSQRVANFEQAQAQAGDFWTRVKAISQYIDNGDPPKAWEVWDANAPQLEETLNFVRERVKARWGTVEGELTSGQLKAIEEFLSRMRGRSQIVRHTAARLGTEARDFAYFNYADRRNIDGALGIIWSYPFWYTRCYDTWAQRVAQQPHFASAYFKLWRTLEIANQDLPPWMRQQVNLGNVMGHDLYFNIQSAFIPFYGMFDTFESRAAESVGPKTWGKTLGEWAQALGNRGPSINPVIGILMGLYAVANGNHEGAQAWLGHQAAWERPLGAATAGLRELGVKAIPPGGLGLPLPYMYEETDNGWRYTGDMWQKRRFGKHAYDIVQRGDFTEKEAVLGLYAHSGELYDRTLQEAQLARAVPTLLSYVAGYGFKPRSATEAEIDKMWEARLALMENRDTMTLDEYKQAWRNLNQQYPMMDYIAMARGTKDERDEALVWKVLDWQPPGWRKHHRFEDLGVMDLLGRFYDAKGDMSDWSDADRHQLMGAVLQIAEETDIPGPETRQEWHDADRRKAELDVAAKAIFGQDIKQLEDQYWEAEDQEAFLAEHPELEEYWQWKDERQAADPLLAKWGRRPVEYWTVSDASSVFFDLYENAVQPGEMEWKLKDDLPLMRAIRDYDIRQSLKDEGWTVEQYKTAIEQLKAWLAENHEQFYGTQGQWKEAREIAKDFYTQRERRFGADFARLLDRYYEADRNEKEILKRHFPELEQYWEWRDAFGAEHPVWARYYDTDLYEDLHGPVQPTVPVGKRGPIPAVMEPRRSEPERQEMGWNELVSLADREELTALFSYWMGDRKSLSAVLKLWQRYGWGDFEDWLQWLRDQYESVSMEA